MEDFKKGEEKNSINVDFFEEKKPHRDLIGIIIMNRLLLIFPANRTVLHS